MAGPPKTLKLEASSGYDCQPCSRTYDTAGTHVDPVYVVLTGAPGDCVVTGTLGASEATDAAEVT